MKQPNHDVTRLPKWAQDKMCILSRRVEDLEGEIAVLTGEQESRVGYGYDLGTGKAPRATIPEHDPVIMQVDEGHIELLLEGDRDRVRVIGTARALVINPSSGNSIYLSLGDS